MKIDQPIQRPLTTDSEDPVAGGNWKQAAAVATVAAAATVVGTLGGMEIGAQMLADHVADATAGHGVFAILTAPLEITRGLLTHVLPWAAGTGTVTGALGYAAGKAAFKGAPLKED